MSETSTNSTSKVKTNHKRIDWQAVGLQLGLTLTSAVLAGLAQAAGARVFGSITSSNGEVANVIPIKKVM